MFVDFSSNKWDTGTRQNQQSIIKWLNNITQSACTLLSEERVATLSTAYGRCGRGFVR
ncbi:protein of unknown function [Serratia sp. Tan611]|nr:protein of unknown function [Serratia sp. Tan611]